jgi:23S rRNA pseudouridine2605 synthase
VRALLAARQLESLVLEGKSHLYVAGELPVFAPLAQPVADDVDAQVVTTEGDAAKGQTTERIAKFVPSRKPFVKRGRDDRAAGGRDDERRPRPAQSFDRERRPFRRDEQKPRFDQDRPKRDFTRPWEEEKRDRDARRPRSFEASAGDAPRPRRPRPEGQDFERRGADDRRPSFGSRPRPSFGDRPRKDFGDKPRRDFGDRPRKDFADRPRRDAADRPRKDFGEKRPFGRDDRERPSRPRGEFSGKPRFSRESGSEDRGAREGQRPGRPPFRKFDAPRDFRKPRPAPRFDADATPTRAEGRPKRSFGDREPFARRKPSEGGKSFSGGGAKSFSGGGKSFSGPRKSFGGPQDGRKKFAPRKPFADGESTSERPRRFSSPEGAAGAKKKSFGKPAGKFSDRPRGGDSGKPAGPFDKFKGNKKPFGKRGAPARKVREKREE